MNEMITERDEADAMFESFDAANAVEDHCDDFDDENTTEIGDADIDWDRAEEQTNGFTNRLIAENQHYKELTEWFESMSVAEFALWKLLKIIHSY